jgi:hypothetical protein
MLEGGQSQYQQFYTVSFIQEPGWNTGTVWTGVENTPPTLTGMRSPDRRACGQFLYRRSYLGARTCIYLIYVYIYSCVVGCGL